MTTIVGLDSSGKTTFLYLLKTGKIVTTIPSIGFNVETIDVATACGIPFRMTGWDVGTGCRDLKYLYDIIRIYIFQSDAIIWLIDSSDRRRLTESVEALQHLLTWLDTQSFADSDEMSHKNFPILMSVFLERRILHI
ncbi:ADP-ribosylation factor family-domain-containing protein [Flammula alnicola]|nr:ADP-ribosylation factor family-domain-containing protein [Flammula alnicola]